jgi:glycosyltransferase involved in cell wall biosynthesis
MAQVATNVRKVRILQVIGSMHIGGAENAVVNLARGIDAERFDLGVCCTNSLGVLADTLAGEGVDVTLASPTRRALRYLTPLYLARAISRFRPDVVHTHGTPALLHAGPLATLRLLPRWIHTFHYGNYPLANRRQMAGERMLSRIASRLIAVSEPQRKRIIECHRIPPQRISTILNGVTDNPFVSTPAVRNARRAEFGFGPNDIVVGCVAVLSAQKGIAYFLEAAQQILNHDNRTALLIAGGGPLEAALREKARALELGPRVVFTGWRQDNLELLTALDIFVMSSLWEAMPMALLEAMAARRPIVTTDVGDNRHVVDNGRCGLVVPAADSSAIATAVLELVSRPHMALEMSQRAHARFSEYFTTAHMVTRYEQLYCETLRHHYNGVQHRKPDSSDYRRANRESLSSIGGVKHR